MRKGEGKTARNRGRNGKGRTNLFLQRICPFSYLQRVSNSARERKRRKKEKETGSETRRKEQ
jgi:hypothetical protein